MPEVRQSSFALLGDLTKVNVVLVSDSIISLRYFAFVHMPAM